MRQRLDKFISAIASGLALVGAVAMIAMLLHVTAYVVSRHVLSRPIPATIEIVSNYYMLGLAFLPIAWAERRGDMIRVEIFAHLFTGPLGRINHVFVSLVTCAAYIALTYTTWLVAMRHFATKSFVISLSIAVPTWPAYFVLPVGFALAALVALYGALSPPLEGKPE
ncbi:TRAP transporter small permease [Pelagibacterium limicola]|uniref:TRAP transporter small permease n=1 Tax=Pelagibacterium limicola TaxID=2791022 RepID=UPI0018AFA00F|nr:TRAP transporter small permease [Pelagibacterium limicola]